MSEQEFARIVARAVWFAWLRERREEAVHNPWDFSDEPPPAEPEELAKPLALPAPQPSPILDVVDKIAGVPVRCPQCREFALLTIQDGITTCPKHGDFYSDFALVYLSGPTADDPPSGG